MDQVADSYQTRRRRFLGLCLAILAFLVPSIAWIGDKAKADETKSSTVKLIIDYNDGAQKVFPAILWKNDMTVHDAMNQAQVNPHGIKFEAKGSGATAFLTQIDDLKNEGGGADKKNWLYRVNGKLAEKGFGAFVLNAGDEVVWKFDILKP
jgi:hypothetical protein